MSSVESYVEGERRTFAQRVGGRWALSIRGFVIAVGIGVVGYTSDFSRIPARDSLLVLAGIAMALTLTAAISVTLHRTRWSRRHIEPVPVGEFVAVNLVTGAVIATVLAVLREVFDVDVFVNTAEGFVIYPALSVWIASSVVVYLDVVDQARRLRERVVDERARALRIRRGATDMVDLLRRRLDDTLGPQIDRLRSVADDPPAHVSQEIREVVDGPVRRVSRELWQSADGLNLRIGVVGVLRFLVAHPRFRPWPIIGLTVLLPLLRRTDDPQWIVLVAAAFAAIAVYVECTLANRLMDRSPRSTPAVLIATLVVFVSQAVLTDRSLQALDMPTSELSVGTIAALTPILILVTSALGSYRDLDERRALQLATFIRSDRLDAMAEARVVSEEARRLAGLLHGRVQSRLLGCAMAIEFAGDDPAALEEAIVRTRSVLEDEWSVASQGVRTVDDLLAPWQGLAEIEVTGDVDSLGEADAQVIEELVANAVRHGRARRVEVAVEHEETGRVITVSDDGQALGEGRPGLGTTLMERVGVVERRPSASGWVVSVRVWNDR